MTVLILERVSPSLRGEITRWLLEPKAGVFIGNISARVRDRLWQRACQNAREGACMLIHSSNAEQGFKIDFWNDTSRHVHDWEGLQLITKPK
jgi:CRISPR-associated protein Cas2